MGSKEEPAAASGGLTGGRLLKEEKRADISATELKGSRGVADGEFGDCTEDSGVSIDIKRVASNVVSECITDDYQHSHGVDGVAEVFSSERTLRRSSSSSTSSTKDFLFSSPFTSPINSRCRLRGMVPS